MKLFEDFDTQYFGSERYSLYQHNKVDNYLIKNSLKFLLFNTNEKNLENCLLQYELLKSIDVSPIIFTPNLDYFIKNKIPENNLIETDGFSYINCFNEIIRYSNSNYVFIINSNIILDNLNEIVNRFYIIYQNFSDKVAGWSINIKNSFKNKIYHEFKIDENVYFSPILSLDFFCVKSEYLKKIGLLSYVRDNVRDNEDCQGLDYLLGWLVNVNKEYLINDFNIELILTEEKNEDSISNEEKLNKIIEKQYFFFEANKSIYHLNDDFFNFWKANILQL